MAEEAHGGWPAGSYGSGANNPASTADKDFTQIPVSHDHAENEQTINTMAGRAVKSYVAAAQAGHSRVGERFYQHDAFGAAHAIASGIDPDSRVGKLYRRPPVGASQHAVDHPDLSVAERHPEMLPDIHRAAGVIAHFSPQTPYAADNIPQAWEAYHMPQHNLDNLQNDVRDPSKPADKKTGKHGRMSITDESGAKMHLNSKPGKDILTGVKMARGEIQPEDAIGTSPEKRVKVGSFLDNVEHPSTSPHTTTDFRHHDVLNGQLADTSVDRGLSSPSAAPKPGKDPSKGHQRLIRYRMTEEATNRATDTINRDHADLRHQAGPLHPSQVQSVIWHGDQESVDRQMGGTMSKTGNHLRMGEGGKPLSRSDLGRPLGQ